MMMIIHIPGIGEGSEASACRGGGGITSRWSSNLDNSTFWANQSEALTSPGKAVQHVIRDHLQLWQSLLCWDKEETWDYRIEEHWDICMKQFTNRPAITEHTWTKAHPINWKKARVLDCAAWTTDFVMKEVLCIQITPESKWPNQDEGYWILGYWITTMKKLPGEGVWYEHFLDFWSCVSLSA